MNYNYKDILNQAWITPGRAVNELGFNTLTAIHDNTEKLVAAALDRAPWATDENRNALHEWFEAAKTGRNNIKALVDENIKTFEGFIAAL